MAALNQTEASTFASFLAAQLPNGLSGVQCELCLQYGSYSPYADFVSLMNQGIVGLSATVNKKCVAVQCGTCGQMKLIDAAIVGI